MVLVFQVVVGFVAALALSAAFGVMLGKGLKACGEFAY
jgi:hypothetical protein